MSEAERVGVETMGADAYHAVTMLEGVARRLRSHPEEDVAACERVAGHLDAFAQRIRGGEDEATMRVRASHCGYDEEERYSGGDIGKYKGWLYAIFQDDSVERDRRTYRRRQPRHRRRWLNANATDPRRRSGE